jgi:hypothetical protein
MVADCVSEVQLPGSSSLQFIRAGVCNDVLPMQPMLSLANIWRLISARPLLITDGIAAETGVISVDVAVALAAKFLSDVEMKVQHISPYSVLFQSEPGPSSSSSIVTIPKRSWPVAFSNNDDSVCPAKVSSRVPIVQVLPTEDVFPIGFQDVAQDNLESNALVETETESEVDEIQKMAISLSSGRGRGHPKRPNEEKLPRCKLR